MATLYDILGVEPSANQDAIRVAYVNLIKRYRIDKGDDAQARMQEITQAYDALKDPQQRSAYDAALSRPGGETSASPARDPARASRPAAYAAPDSGAALQHSMGEYFAAIGVGAIAAHISSFVLFEVLFYALVWLVGWMVAFNYGTFLFLASLIVGAATGYGAWLVGQIAAERMWYGAEYTFANRQAAIARGAASRSLLNPDAILITALVLCLLRLVFLDGQPNALSAQFGTAVGMLFAHRLMRWG